jgi:hypothetical protein
VQCFIICVRAFVALVTGVALCYGESNRIETDITAQEAAAAIR